MPPGKNPNQRNRREDWRRIAQNMRQDFRQNYQTPTFEPNTPFPEPDKWDLIGPKNVNSRGDLAQKLQAQKQWRDARAYSDYVTKGPGAGISPGNDITNPGNPDPGYLPPMPQNASAANASQYDPTLVYGQYMPNRNRPRRRR